jgi:hypothetical protein
MTTATTETVNVIEREVTIDTRYVTSDTATKGPCMHCGAEVVRKNTAAPWMHTVDESTVCRKRLVRIVHVTLAEVPDRFDDDTVLDTFITYFSDLFDNDDVWENPAGHFDGQNPVVIDSGEFIEAPDSDQVAAWLAR